MELFARFLRGYYSFSDNKVDQKFVDMIMIDSNYSPVRNITYDVTPTKVGKSENLEKLTIELKTNNSISATEVIAFAAKILTDHLDFFVNLDQQILEDNLIAAEIEQEDVRLINLFIH